jgi:hypothetical protein
MPEEVSLIITKEQAQELLDHLAEDEDLDDETYNALIDKLEKLTGG